MESILYRMMVCVSGRNIFEWTEAGRGCNNGRREETKGMAMTATSRWIRSGIVCLVLVAVALRVYMYAVGTSNVPVTSDEALTVLQAVDIRNGKFPLLMASQPYMFPVEAYWMAPLEPLLPRTAAGMRTLILLEGFALTALGLWILRRMGRWREVWPGALLVLFPSAYALLTQTAYSMPYYASPVILVFLAVGCCAVLDPPAVGRKDEVRREGLWAALGAFFLGMAVSNSLAVLGMAVPLAVVALWNTAGRARGRSLAWRVGGFVVGGFLGLLPHLLSKWTIPGAHAAVSKMYSWNTAWERLWKMTIPYVLPGTLGCRPCRWPDSGTRLAGYTWTPVVFTWGAIAVIAAALVLIIVRLLREGVGKRRWPVMGPFEWALGTSVAALVLDSLNRRATSSDLRYLLPVVYVAPFLLTGLWLRLRGRIVRWTFGIVVVALAAYDATTSLRLAELWKAPGFASDAAGVPDLAPALKILREQDIHHAVASYWAAYRIGFESGGDVVCSQPQNERFPGWPLPYKAEVDEADDVAYVLTDSIRFLKPAQFEEHMRKMGVEADVFPAGEFQVYCHFRRPNEDGRSGVLSDEFGISANNAPEKAEAMVDGDIATYWRSDILQTEGMAVECEFRKPVPLAGILLRYGSFGHDRPKEIGIEVRRKGGGAEDSPGSGWETVENMRVMTEPFVWQHEHPVYLGHACDHIEFSSKTDVEAVRISIIRPNPQMAWTLCEVLPLVAAGDAGL